MLNWRELLNDIGVEWVDRGKNVSRGNICIACPFCGDDNSHHLSISESKDAYYCFRNPDHSGSSINRLLVALGLSYNELNYTLNNYNSDIVPVAVKKKPTASSIASWNKFESAANNPKAVDYLRERGFITPVATCRLYDLRYAKEGKWAQRLLLPITEKGKVVSWSGRALKLNLEPKYLNETNEGNNYLYVPRSIRETLVIVEGPMDALKIAVATQNEDISSMSLLGKGMSPEKLQKIADLAKDCKQIFVCFDSDVGVGSVYNFIYELSARASVKVGNLTLPYGYKDPAEMDNDEIVKWIPG